MLRWWLADEVVDARGSLATFTARRTAPGGGSGPVTADEYAAFQLQFARGTLASVVVSAVDPTDSGLRIEIVGATGRLLLDGFDSLSLAIGRTAPRDISVADTLIGQPTIGLNAWRTSLVRYGEHLLECIRDGRACSGATLEEGVTIQRVLESVRGSAAAAIREGKRQW
jgi:predicted dehydrogenase